MLEYPIEVRISFRKKRDQINMLIDNSKVCAVKYVLMLDDDELFKLLAYFFVQHFFIELLFLSTLYFDYVVFNY